MSEAKMTTSIPVSISGARRFRLRTSFKLSGWVLGCCGVHRPPKYEPGIWILLSWHVLGSFVLLLDNSLYFSYMVYQNRTFGGFLPDSASQRLLYLKGVSVLMQEHLAIHKDGQGDLTRKDSC